MDNVTVRPALDPDCVLERVGGDIEFLQEITGLVLEDCPKLLEDIRAAIAKGDAPALQHAAHTLKGSVANFGAEPAREAAFQLEVLGRSGKLDAAQAVCGALEAEIQRFTQALTALARSVSSK